MIIVLTHHPKSYSQSAHAQLEFERALAACEEVYEENITV